jgi:putative ABC transport system permease protein
VERVTGFAEEFVARLEATPAVTAAAYARQLPLVALRDTLRVARTPGAGAPGAQGADARFVSRQYFGALGIRLLAGRGFEEGDAAGQPKVLVINDSLATREFGDAAKAIGQQAYVAADPQPWLIVGVVADLRLMGLQSAPVPQFFIDARQWIPGFAQPFPLSPYYAVRFNGDEQAAIAAINAAVHESRSEGLVFNLARMEAIVSSSVARPRLYAVLLGTFASVGLAMALIGIYSVMSYTVSQQTREIGIRMALGARPGLVRTQVLRHALALTVIGIAAGLVAARVLSLTLESMLFGLTPLDVPTFSGVAVLFVLAAALAAYAPASRASKIDPLVAIRTE